MKAYFERLQQEHNVTCVEFVADQAKGEGRISRRSISMIQSRSMKALDARSVTQRPSFQSDSERLSSAPKRPSRTSSCESLVTLQEALALLNDLPAQYQPSGCQDNTCKTSSLTHIRTSRALNNTVLVTTSK